MIDMSKAFILLDDARSQGAAPARLYHDPVRCVSANNVSELPAMFDMLRQAKDDGLHISGYIAYEAGYGLEKTLENHLSDSDKPLAWFGIFNNYQILSKDELTSCFPNCEGVLLGDITPDISRKEYAEAFQKVQDYIAAGDIYQANLTFRASAQYSGHPMALYAALRQNAAAGYGGVVWTGVQWHLSFSPELFFALKNGHVTTKPMKGTAARNHDAVTDQAIIDELQQDPKQRAENLMIVDLLRNDLSRICKSGTVNVPELFKVESYPTIHQMISTVTGDMMADKDAIDLIEAIFPCGSITGAPKIRAMQIIDEVESDSRGLYCGSIGRIDPNGDAAFNVAIRTFSLSEEERRVSLGLGSGVVADSNEAAEWEECLAKGEFARMPKRRFDLIETMRFEPAEGILRLEMHLERMKESARALDFTFDRHETRNRLHAVTFHLEKPSKLRLLLSNSGAVAIEIGSVPNAVMKDLATADKADTIFVEPVALPVDSSDFRLQHKTTDRAFYDIARQGSRGDEVVFYDKEGFLTEGSRNAIFMERDGMLITPPLSRGLLPSILRREMIESGKAIEGDIHIDDLKSEFFMGSSLRGLIPAKRLA